MFRVEQAYLDRLITSVDLVGLIRQSTRLREVGQGRHGGSCPFHAGSPEGTLIVDESAHRFSCEHCQFSGSAIGWLMYHDGHSFRSAISELSRETGLDASMWIDADDLAAERADHIELLGEVAEHYHRRLLDCNGILTCAGYHRTASRVSHLATPRLITMHKNC